MNKINYQRELDQILAEITAKGEVPTLLLHSCMQHRAAATCCHIWHLISALRCTIIIRTFHRKKNIKNACRSKCVWIRELPVRYPICFEEGVYDPERFLRWRKGWKIYRRAESAAFAVMN